MMQQKWLFSFTDVSSSLILIGRKIDKANGTTWYKKHGTVTPQYSVDFRDIKKQPMLAQMKNLRYIEVSHIYHQFET